MEEVTVRRKGPSEVSQPWPSLLFAHNLWVQMYTLRLENFSLDNMITKQMPTEDSGLVPRDGRWRVQSLSSLQQYPHYAFLRLATSFPVAVAFIGGNTSIQNISPCDIRLVKLELEDFASSIIMDADGTLSFPTPKSRFGLSIASQRKGEYCAVRRRSARVVRAESVRTGSAARVLNFHTRRSTSPPPPSQAPNEDDNQTKKTHIDRDGVQADFVHLESTSSYWAEVSGERDPHHGPAAQVIRNEWTRGGGQMLRGWSAYGWDGSWGGAQVAPSKWRSDEKESGQQSEHRRCNETKKTQDGLKATAPHNTDWSREEGHRRYGLVPGLAVSFSLRIMSIVVIQIRVLMIVLLYYEKYTSNVTLRRIVRLGLEVKKTGQNTQCSVTPKNL
ncbi:hypothetical protein C8J56DRAFT_891184 [Mycena floridula]|nr:hypothetical protein C8J56DRAFT_891184 [Mycena floridula]